MIPTTKLTDTRRLVEKSLATHAVEPTSSLWAALGTIAMRHQKIQYISITIYYRTNLCWNISRYEKRWDGRQYRTLVHTDGQLLMHTGESAHRGSVRVSAILANRKAVNRFIRARARESGKTAPWVSVRKYVYLCQMRARESLERESAAKAPPVRS